MKLNPKLRNILKWTATIAALVVLTAWLGSARWSLEWTLTDRVRICLISGCIEFENAPREYYEGAQGIKLSPGLSQNQIIWTPVRYRPWGKWSTHMFALWPVAAVCLGLTVLLWAPQARAAWHRQVPRSLLFGSALTGALALALITGAFLVSLRWNWTVSYYSRDLMHGRWISLYCGGLKGCWNDATFYSGPLIQPGWSFHRAPPAWLMLPNGKWEGDPTFYRTIAIACPFWLPALLISIPTALLTRRYLATRPKDRCASCGYPRAGLPPTSPCPECGAPPASFPAPTGRTPVARGEVGASPTQPLESTPTTTTAPAGADESTREVPR